MAQFPNTHWSLIEAAKAGDSEAFSVFLQRYRAAVQAYLARHVGREEAEDLSQEVFLRFYTNALERVDPTRGRFRNLLLAVTRRVLSDAWRREHALKRERARTVPLGKWDPEAPEEADAFDREWVQNLVQHALSELKRTNADYYQVIRLFFLEGLPQAQIAIQLNKSVASVKNFVYQGKKKLLSFVKQEVMRYCCTEEEYQAEIERLARFFPT